MPLTIYTLKTCDTCRRATKWLKANGVAFEEKPIRESPPTAAQIRTMLEANDGNLRRVFNTSGREYREQQIGDRLGEMDDKSAVELLAGNGSLIKRPFAIGPGVALVGFDEVVWRSAFRR